MHWARGPGGYSANGRSESRYWPAGIGFLKFMMVVVGVLAIKTDCLLVLGGCVVLCEAASK